MNGRPWRAMLPAFALGLAACTLAPRLKVPEVATADAYKETGPWIKAQPASELPHDNWWALYASSEVDELQQRLVRGNPDLAVALAHFDEARAIRDQARSAYFPTIAAGGGTTRQRTSKDVANPAPQTLFDTDTVQATASYELDLWGRIRSLVAAGKANAAAAAADLEDARLSLRAQLVDSYVQLRSLDRTSAILDETVSAYDRALHLTELRHNAGIAPGLDVAEAETQLNRARSEAEQTLAQRAVVEHAIAALIGEPATTFSIKPAIVELQLPHVPVGVPSSLLQRRPDIVAARRRMEAANAGIGAARAAYFPLITIDGQGGYASAQRSNLFTAPSELWAVGPAALLTLFDGGLHRAQVRQARAEFDASAATYRGTVLAAFQQVEDDLALMSHYGVAAVSQKSALDAAQHALTLSLELYRQGAADYLAVVTSQTAALQTQLDALNLETLRLRASVALIRAVGGGWDGEGHRSASGGPRSDNEAATVSYTSACQKQFTTEAVHDVGQNPS